MKLEILMGKRLTSEECKLLASFAKGDMRCVKAAEELGCSDVNVRKHLNEISERTGIDPRSFFGLCALLGIRSVGNKDVCFVFFDGGSERFDLNKHEVQFCDSEVFRWKKKR